MRTVSILPLCCLLLVGAHTCLKDDDDDDDDDDDLRKGTLKRTAGPEPRRPTTSPQPITTEANLVGVFLLMAPQPIRDLPESKRVQPKLNERCTADRTISCSHPLNVYADLAENIP